MTLNAAQRQAVESTQRVVRVIAGAGSGKTTVLVERLRLLLKKYPADRIVALSFTHKAAQELQHRLAEEGLWTGTFHAYARRLLQSHGQQLKIIDAEDRRTIVQQWLSAKKKGEASDAEAQRVYEDYCAQHHCGDLALLLRRACALLAEPQVAAKLALKAVLVDEFQECTPEQMALLRALVGPECELFVVGDDDQSIAALRGTQPSALLELEHDFPGVETIALAQNYRSTQNILCAANALIANNAQRYPKALWSLTSPGEKIALYSASNDREEARYVVDAIEARLAEGSQAQDCAVLYRTREQAPIFEQMLRARAIPCSVRGLSFFARPEIKDALAYLRLSLGESDDLSIAQVLNQPPRGIGAKARSALHQRAKTNGQSLWACLKGDLQAQFNTRTARALAAFVAEIEALRENASPSAALHKLLPLLLRAHPEAAAPLQELQELAANCPDAPSFWAQLPLERESAGEGVQLMTVHAAKGLEFPHVFLVGWEERLFPLVGIENVDEERRLAYVGMTRAQKTLSISCAERRRVGNKTLHTKPSRFVRELPPKLLNVLRRVGVSHPAGKVSGPFALGARVVHASFGEGRVLNYEGSGAHLKVWVDFERGGKRCLVVRFAGLERC